MAVLITDHRTTWDEADSTTGWAGGAAGLFTADPDPVESTGCIGVVVSTATVDSYYATTATNLSNKLVYVWANLKGAMDTYTNGGAGIHIGDGTNRIAFHVGGSDVAGFRHDTGPVEWQCYVVDTSKLPTTTSVRQGSLAALNTGSITQIGMTFKTLAKSKGGVANCFTDIIRIADPTLNNGATISITSGSSTDPGTFAQIATADRQTGNLEGYGIVRQLGVGAFGVQGKLRFGNATGTSGSWFEDGGVAVVFEDRGLETTRYGIYITDNGVGTTTFKLGTKVGSGTTATGTGGATLTVPVGVGGEFDSQTDTNVTDVFIYGSTFNGFSNGIKLGGNGQEFIGNIVNQSGTIIPSGTLFYNNNINESIASSSLYWNSNLDTLGYIDGCSFLGSGSNSHAIEYGPSAPVSTSLAVFFENYGANSASNAAIYNNSGKDLYINIPQGYDEPTVRNGAGAGTRVVAGLITVTLTGLVSGSEVRVMAAGTANELAGTEGVATTPASFPFALSQGTEVDIVVHNIQYEYLRINNFTVPSTATSIPIEQRFDRNYSNP